MPALKSCEACPSPRGRGRAAAAHIHISQLSIATVLLLLHANHGLDRQPIIIWEAWILVDCILKSRLANNSNTSNKP